MPLAGWLILSASRQTDPVLLRAAPAGADRQGRRPGRADQGDPRDRRDDRLLPDRPARCRRVVPPLRPARQHPAADAPEPGLSGSGHHVRLDVGERWAREVAAPSGTTGRSRGRYGRSCSLDQLLDRRFEPLAVHRLLQQRLALEATRQRAQVGVAGAEQHRDLPVDEVQGERAIDWPCRLTSRTAASGLVDRNRFIASSSRPTGPITR